MSKIPEYKGWDAIPDHLSTKTRMNKELGLRLARGQKPVATVRVYVGRWTYYDLYDITEAIPKRKPTEAQLKQLAAARRIAQTTKCCNRFVGDINWRYKGNLCWRCWDDLQHREHLEFLSQSRTEAAQWAKGVLDDPGAVILDTETTGLEDAEIVEIAIIDPAGQVLLDTLVKPANPIPAEASRLHGITNDLVKDAPTWSEIDDQVRGLLHKASRIVVYNAAFDLDMMLRCTRRLYNLPPWEIDTDRWECAMEQYAMWYGEWSDYYESFKWQPLIGDHRALGDCQATLARLRKMAGGEQ